MAAFFRHKVLAFPTSTGDFVFDYGAVGETPRAVMFFITKYTDATLATTTYSTGIVLSAGFTDGTRNRAFCNAVKNGASPDTDVWSRGSATRCVIAIDDDTGALLFDAHFKDWTVPTGGNAGFTLTVDTAAAGAPQQYAVAAVCFFGDWEAWAGTNDTSVSDFTDPGFQPDIAFLCGGGGLVLDDTTYSPPTLAQFSFGFVNRFPLSNHSRSWAPDTLTGAANQVWSYVANARCFNIYNRTVVVDDLYVTAFTQSGWTQAGTAAGSEICCLALRKTTPGPCDMGASTYSLATAPTGNKSVRGFRGTPNGLISTLGKVTNVNTLTLGTTAECFGLSFVDDAGLELCLSVKMKNDATGAASLMQARFADIERITLVLGNVGRYAGDWVSYDESGGFTWNVTNAGGQQHFQTLALGSTGSKLWTRGAGLLRGSGLIR